MQTASSRTLVAYVAAPHGGYLKLFREFRDGGLFILGREFINEHSSLVRHLPGNDPEDARTMIGALGIFSRVSVLSKADIPELPSRFTMPDDDIARLVAARHFSDREVVFDSRWKLRWDLSASVHHRQPEGEVRISRDEFDRELMTRAFGAARRSPDWWRQVGALLVRDGEPLLVAFNTHVPSDQEAYVMGDPRSNFEAGQHIEASLAAHGEAAVIAAAAAQGIRTEGCDLYVTTFPCVPCATSIMGARIRRLFYVEGYSVVRAAEAMRSRGIELIRVDMQ